MINYEYRPRPEPLDIRAIVLGRISWYVTMAKARFWFWLHGL